jgi:hypothetical protein
MSKPFVFATGIYASGNWESAQLVPQNVIDVVSKYTALDIEPSGVNVRIDSPELFEYPFLFITGHLPVFFSAPERTNLKRYVENGGFLFVDDHNHDIFGAFHETMTAELEGMFGELTRVPDDHRLYNAFFEFEDGPPTTSHELNGWGDGLIHDYLLGIMDGDRVDVLYSNKDYSSEWHMHLTDNRDRHMQEDPAKIAVNFVVYALTR